MVVCCCILEVSIAKSVDPDQTAPYSLHVLLLNVPVYSCGHVGKVSSPNHTFSLGKLEQVVNQFFVHILLLVTDNNPSEGRRNDRRNYFMINLHESMGPGRDPTRDLRHASLQTALRGAVVLHIEQSDLGPY